MKQIGGEMKQNVLGRCPNGKVQNHRYMVSDKNLLSDWGKDVLKDLQQKEVFTKSWKQFTSSILPTWHVLELFWLISSDRSVPWSLGWSCLERHPSWQDKGIILGTDQHKVLELRNDVPSQVRALWAKQRLWKQIRRAIESQREP